MATPFQVCAAIVTGSGSSRSYPVANATAAGDTLTAIAVVNNTNGTVSALADSQGNTWVLDDSFTTAQPMVYAFRCQNSAAALSTSDTFTLTTAALSANIELYVTDAGNTGALDNTPAIVTGTGTTPSVSATPAANNDTAISMWGTANAGGSPTVNSPFTGLGSFSTGSNPFSTGAYDLISGGSGVAQTSTLTIVSANWRGVMWLFQPGAAGVTGTGGVALSALAFAGSGTVAVTGTGGLALAALALAGSGQVTVTGTGGLALAALAFAGSAAGGVSGSGGLALSALALAGSGTDTRDLILSLAPTAGTDPYGNTYPQGLGVSKGAIPGTLLNPSSVPAAAVNFTARSIGGITTTVSATAPGSPQAGDLWINTSAGNALYQYSGGTWSLYQFGTGSIAANSITAAQIAANTITASQLAAGIIYAGIVDSTTITAATFNGGTYNGTDFVINTSGEFYYSGIPAAGNLIFSISNADGTDGFGNGYINGLTFYSGNLSTDLFISYRAGGIFFGTIANADAGTGGLIFEAPQITRVVGKFLATNPATGNSDETWHTLSLQNSFTAGTDINGTSYPPAYMLLPDGRVALRGELITPATGTVTGVTFATVAGAYSPETNIPTATVVTNNGAQAGVAYIRPNGNLQLAGAFGNSANIHLDCTLNVQGT